MKMEENSMQNEQNNKETPISILVEAGVNLENKGGQWLLLMLEEKSLKPEKKIKPIDFYRNLNPNENIDYRHNGYKSMMMACSKELAKNHITVYTFINKYFN